jgi:hypothetical protein
MKKRKKDRIKIIRNDYMKVIERYDEVYLPSLLQDDVTAKKYRVKTKIATFEKI